MEVPRAVSVQSGTSALHIALIELGITSGDEAILPALTFVASANPIRYVGATPVFADVDPVTWNILPEKIEKSHNEKDKSNNACPSFTATHATWIPL